MDKEKQARKSELGLRDCSKNTNEISLAYQALLLLNTYEPIFNDRK